MQKTLTRLRDMWRRSDALFIPATDLNALHSMHCKSQCGGAGVIPTHIASDHRKLARYYIFLLFRYGVSAAAGSSSFSGRATTGRSDAQLPDVPPSWLDGRASLMYPSAPPSESVVSPTHTGNVLPSSYYQHPQAREYYDDPAWQHRFQPTPTNREADVFAMHDGHHTPLLRDHVHGVAQQRPNPTNARYRQPVLRNEPQTGASQVGGTVAARHQADANNMNLDGARRYDGLYPSLPAGSQQPAIKRAYEPEPYGSNDESD